MITFAISNDTFNVYVNDHLVGYLIPEIDGIYWSDSTYAVIRLASDGSAIAQGMMTMAEARNLFEAIYC